MNTAWWRRKAADITLALLFLLALMPANLNYGSRLADWIWLIGAGLMGLLVLVRIPPRTAMITPQTLIATGASMILPALMRPERSSSGLIATAAIGVELIGVTVSQVSRLYLGRRFALLPANRGIVTAGPFRLVRHPIYAGWLILSIGYVMTYPTVRNGLLVLSTLPFILWRIEQEESLLADDLVFRSYRARTRWRLVPFIY